MIRVLSGVPPGAVLTLPPWLVEESGGGEVVLRGPEPQMRFVLELGRRGVEEGGGPFAAAVFEEDGGLLAAGVNLVLAGGSSLLHAEVVAILAAQSRVGGYSLAGGGARRRLVASCDPCAMCLGAVHWAGLGSLVTGASTDDARGIGFDEGPVGEESYAYLAARGVEVVRGVLRDEGRALLESYGRGGGILYNPRAYNPSAGPGVGGRSPSKPRCAPHAAHVRVSQGSGLPPGPRHPLCGRTHQREWIMLPTSPEFPIPGVRGLEHTADVGLEVEAPELPELFRLAALGAMWLVREREGPAGEEDRTLEVEGAGLPGLLRAWLRALLLLHELEGFVVTEAEVALQGETGLAASVRGGVGEGDPVREIKGVTLHDLRVERRGEGWYARVIFDV